MAACSGQPDVEYLPDATVSAADDERLRHILRTCFTGPEDQEAFRVRRYWREPPEHRWVIRSTGGQIIAHLAVHEKTIGTPAGDLSAGGVALVCTDPACRRRGYAKRLLAEADAWMGQQGLPFALLVGSAAYYASSGYFPVVNPVRFWDPREQTWHTRPVKDLMAKSLSLIHI